MDGARVQGQDGELMKALLLHLYNVRLKGIKKIDCLDDIGWTVYLVFGRRYYLSENAVSSQTRQDIIKKG